MDCRHTLIACNKHLYLKINTSADYNHKRQIPLKEWFQLWRYEIGFFRRDNGQGYRWWINRSESIW